MVVGFVAPLAAAEPVAEAFLTDTLDSAPALAAIGGGQVVVAWSVTIAPTARTVLTSQRLDADLTENLNLRTVADDIGMPESFFHCPVAAAVGADRVAFAWIVTTRAGWRVAYRVKTTSGDFVSPIRYTEPVMRGQDAHCPRIGGGANSFAIAWPTETRGRRTKVSFRARSFDASGAPLSEPLEVAPSGAAIAFPPGLAVERRGHFTVAWTVLSPSGQAPTRLLMRRFLRTGRAASGVVEIARNTNGSAALATFGSGETEGIEAVWAGARTTGGSGVQVQRFDRQLRPLGESRDVATADSFGIPDLAVDARGRSVVLWEAARPPQTMGLFLDDDLNACEPAFVVSRDRPVSLAKVALPGEDAAVITVIEQTDETRRLAVRKFSLAGCPP
jgi:hypothetical protein